MRIRSIAGKPFIIIMLTVVFVSGLTVSGCSRQPQKKLGTPNGSPIAQPAAPTIGQPLPAFTLEDRNRQSVNVPAGFSGKAVYMMFFSSG